MKISCVIPAYNAARFLERAVNSLMSTGYPDLEVLIVEDGSSDGTLEIAQKLAEKEDCCIRTLRHPDHRNHGVSASRNLGIQQSTGELICFLDADDYVFPNRFNIACEILEGRLDVDGVYGLTRLEIVSTDRSATVWGPDEYFGITRRLKSDELLGTLLKGRVWAVSAILVRRSLLQSVGLFEEGLRTAEDCNLWFRMVVFGKIVPGEFDTAICAYVRHGQNSYKAVPKERIDMISAIALAARWAKKRRVPSDVQKQFSEAISDCLFRTVLLANETADKDLAIKASINILRQRLWYELLRPRILRLLVPLAFSK